MYSDKFDVVFDPVTVAFFSDESLEYGERAGLALIALAECCDITFGEQVLATPSNSTRYGGSSFGFSSGVSMNAEYARQMAELHPKYEKEFLAYAQKIKTFDAVAKKRSDVITKAHDLLDSGAAEWAGGWGGHSNPDFGRIVNMGTEGIRELINEYKAKNSDDCDWFYRGLEYAMDALDLLGDRFLELAKKELAECTDELKKKRYEAAVKAFEVIPRKPAYDFESAVQGFWMLYCFDGIDSPGRFDQYMYRAYAATQDEAQKADALERLWEMFHQKRAWNLCLSGSDENWNDDTNELTYAILKLAAQKKYNTPNITLRVHRNTPEKLWDAIVETLSSGIGMPALYNDEVVCPALEKIGIPACDSHLYCMNGCNQIDIMAKSHMGLEDGEVIFAKCLEYALYNGQNPMNEYRPESIPTGDAQDFETYEEFERAVLRQIEYVTYITCQTANSFQHKRGIYEPHPLRSCLIEGCIEKGKDYRNGGPIYGHGQILAEAIADTGDSMYAVKKLVYDEKKYTMAQLIEALKANFEGYEELRHDFMSCDKFGNDKDGVDEITVRVLNRYLTVLKRNKTYRGGVFTGGCSPFSRAAGYGRCIGALPNGKLNRAPLIADCIGAVPGEDVNGPTALMKSVLKYNHVDNGSGFIFQTKFEKKMMLTEKGRESLKALAKAYFAGGGQQFTATVIDPQELLDALENPGEHKNLIVRVGGYSDHFVNLDSGLQESVIKRTFLDV